MHPLKTSAITYDPFLGDEAVRDAAHWLNEGDWIPAMALLRDPGDRSLQMSMLTSEAVDLAALETWAESHPTALSLTMLAMRQTAEAWAIGRTRPGTRSQDEIDAAFRAQLRIADRTVARACSEHPDTADAWAAAVPIATGLGLGEHAAESRFERAHRLQPFHRNATIAMLRARFARWGGSDDSMFTFARWVTFHNPHDSAVQCALPIAHLEWVAAHGNRQAHLNDIEIRDELKYVVLRFLQATPQEPAPPEQLEALNTFVSVLGRMRPLPVELLNGCLIRIDDRPTAVPWRRGDNDPAAAYVDFLDHLT